MDEQNVVCTHNGILFSLKKEGNSDNCYSVMNLEDIKLSEISQRGKNRHMLCDSTYMLYLE